MRIEKEYLAYTIDKAIRNDYISLVKLAEHYLTLDLTHMAIALLEVASKHPDTYYATNRLKTITKGVKRMKDSKIAKLENDVDSAYKHYLIIADTRTETKDAWENDGKSKGKFWDDYNNANNKCNDAWDDYINAANDCEEAVEEAYIEKE